MCTQCCIPGPPACTQMLLHASEHCHGSLLRNCLSIKIILAGWITTCADSKPPEYVYSHPPHKLHRHQANTPFRSRPPLPSSRHQSQYALYPPSTFFSQSAHACNACRHQADETDSMGAGPVPRVTCQDKPTPPSLNPCRVAACRV